MQGRIKNIYILHQYISSFWKGKPKSIIWCGGSVGNGGSEDGSGGSEWVRADGCHHSSYYFCDKISQALDNPSDQRKKYKKSQNCT